MKAWIRIEINRTQLAGRADQKLEDAILSVHVANDQPLFWLGSVRENSSTSERFARLLPYARL